MIDYLEGNRCLHSVGPQNNIDQIKKRAGNFYCYAKNTYISRCPKKCDFYYSLDNYIVDVEL